GQGIRSIFSSFLRRRLVSDGSRAMLVDQIACAIAIEREGRVQGVRLIAGDSVSKHPAGSGGCLEAAGSPAAIDVYPFHRRLSDDGAGIWAGVDDTAPLPHHPHPPENRKELTDCRNRLFRNLLAAALAIADVVVDSGTDDELALVRLTDVGMHRPRHHDAVQRRLDRLAHQGL